MRSIRWKLVLTFMVVVFVPIYALNRYAIQFFDRYTRKALEDQMVSYAFIAGEQYKSLVLGLGTGSRGGQDAEFDALIRSYLPWTQVRIRIVSPAGVILFDAAESDPRVGMDISHRSEIRSAMAGRYGASARLAADRDYMFYFCALPIRDGDTVVGIAYVSRHTVPIVHAIQRMNADLRLAMLLALAGAAVAAAVLAHTLTRRLRRLSAASRAYASGHGELAVDVSGRDEIGELAGSVRDMAREIERRNHYNRDFISTVFHELKMPLTAIKGSVEVLENGASEQAESRAKFLRNIRYESERMVRLVWELSELTKLDNENLRGQRERVDYGELLRQIVGRLEATFEAPHAAVALRLPEKPVHARVVPGRLEQVLGNLLENAFRYTPVDGRVDISLAVDADGALVTTVRDTGCGISEANLGKVFDRFFTTEPKSMPKDYGSGLGLAIARSIIANHQGTIGVESRAGAGAAFTFRLPACA